MEERLGIAELRHIASRTLGDAPRPWLWGARVRMGVL